MTVSDLRTHVSLLEKSMEVNSFKCNKDGETSSSRKVLVNKGKAPIGNLNVKVPEFSGTI